VDCILLAHDGDMLRAILNTTVRLRVALNAGNLTEGLLASQEELCIMEVFYYQLMHTRIVFKGVLKLTLKFKQLQHVSA